MSTTRRGFLGLFAGLAACIGLAPRNKPYAGTTTTTSVGTPWPPLSDEAITADRVNKAFGVNPIAVGQVEGRGLAQVFRDLSRETDRYGFSRDEILDMTLRELEMYLRPNRQVV